MSKWPEHDKLAEVKDQTQAIGEFLEWCGYEKGIQLASWDDRTDRMYPIPGAWLDLVAEWAGIDRGRLEAEKQQMLDELRAMNED